MKGKKAPMQAQRATRTERVENPYGLGFDRVERIIDSVTAMHRRGQLDDEQAKAAGRYRDAYSLVHSSGIGSTLGGGAGGGSPSGKTPAAAALQAADDIAAAERVLGIIDGTIVRLVVGVGLTINEAAHRVFSGADRKEHRSTGDRLGSALLLLHGLWWPSGSPRSGGIRAELLTPDAKPRGGVAGRMEPGTVAFADGRTVHFSKPRS